MDIETRKLIDRIRRAMPRNVDVMSLCDEVEKRSCPECEKRRTQTRERVRKHRSARSG